MDIDIQTAIKFIPLLPLVGFLYLGWGALRKARASRSAGVIGSLMSAGSFYLAMKVFGEIGDEPVRVELFRWFGVGDFFVDFAFLIDPLACVMMLVVTGVGTLIHIYSISYMRHDPGIRRFFAYLNLFMFAMLLLVMGENLVVLFIGWEGVGLCSYLLIGFWSEKKAFAAAGMKAFIFNRIGDLGFIMGIFALVALVQALPEAATLSATYGPVSFLTLNGLLENLNGDTVLASGVFAGWTVTGVLTFAGIFLFIGACGKSAQIPLFTWLPDAMAGPTPVSALIHAATMVTAGVYMCARLWRLYELAPAAGALIAVVGGLTALVAATIAVTQSDIKKVLAYSTVSQLGYMFIGIGVGAYTAGIFHLVTHAFFKALLFLGAGAVIHALGGHQGSKQDMHKDMGGLRRHMPFTYWIMLIAALAIAGIPPFMSGALSKDEIIFRAALAWQTSPSGGAAYLFALVCGLIAAGFTAFYMFRMIALTFWGTYRGDEASLEHARRHPLEGVMWVPLAILAALSVIGGLINIPHLWGGPAQLVEFLGQGELGLGSKVPDATAHDYASWEWGIQIGLFCLAGVMILLAGWLYTKRGAMLARWASSGLGARLHRASFASWGIDIVCMRYIAAPFLLLAELVWFIVDVLIIDGSVALLALVTQGAGGLLRRLQTGFLSLYTLAIAAGAIVVLGFIVVQALSS